MDKISNRQLPIMVIIVLGIMTTFGPLTIDMYVPSLPNVQHDFSTSVSQAQLTLSFAMIGLAIGNLYLGLCLMHTDEKSCFVYHFNLCARFFTGGFHCFHGCLTHFATSSRFNWRRRDSNCQSYYGRPA